MADITLSGRIAERLEQIARDTNRKIEEIVEEALNLMENSEGARTQGGAEETIAEPPLGTLAHMAWSAAQNPINVGAADVAERSREILHNEYADHLLKHLDAPDDDANE